MKTTIIAALIIIQSMCGCHSGQAEDFQTGTFTPKPGPQKAPLGQVELSKKDGQYFLRFQMANKWKEVGVIKPMKPAELRNAISQDPEPVNARALNNGAVAFVLIAPNTKIRGHTISTGIVLISPFFGPGGTAELTKN